MNNLILIGFKSAGKTTLGKKAAERFTRPFIDTDDYFDPSYDKMRESGFRELEKAYVKSLVGLKGYVIATGGGVPLDPENQEVLRQLGTVVFLDTPKEVIVQRMPPEKHGFFLPHYERRLGIYNSMAHYCISSEDELWEVMRLDPFSE